MYIALAVVLLFGAQAQIHSKTLLDSNPFDFSKFVANPSEFCSDYQAFDANAAFICAGGGAEGPGGSCDKTACSNGQYTFSSDDTWIITTPWSTASPVCSSGGPYRAFTYLPLVTKQLNALQKLTLSFDLSLDGYKAGWNGNRVLILFYGDDSKRPFLDITDRGLALFQGTTVPFIGDGKWWTVTVEMDLGNQAKLTISDAQTGQQLATGTTPCADVCMTQDQWGLQLGQYIFPNYSGGASPTGTLAMKIKGLKIGLPSARMSTLV